MKCIEMIITISNHKRYITHRKQCIEKTVEFNYHEDDKIASIV